MVALGSTTLACLLLGLASLTTHACAAEQRDDAGDPYLVLPPGIWPDDNISKPSKDLGELEFTLRHVYHRGTHKYPRLHRYLDVPADVELSVAGDEGQGRVTPPRVLRAKAVSTNIQRMVDRSRSTVDKLLDHARIYGTAESLPARAWTTDQIAGPDTTDKSTIISLAWMAANAYVEEPFTGDWNDVGGGFNNTDDFGWENDGLRGHIFATKDNSTIVIGLKGTSAAVFDGPETTGNDKLNDNLFGSCCCAQGGDYMWKQVCDCRTSAFTCNQTCLVQALREKSHYYQASQDLYHNVTARYPNSEVWLSGHSLGGVLSTLVGLTYGLPVVTFEAYPDAMAANRLGLPTPPGYRIGAHQSRNDIAVHHFGHTADSIFVGQCHGTLSPCSLGGYAFEGSCHTGKKCIYDTVNDKNWRMGIGYHKILGVIRDVLEEYDTVANCTEQLDCTDCYNWKFFRSNGSEITSSSSAAASTSTYTRTRTETCQTPGWWGCLDETTTTASTTTTSSSTSTCETPGWFGCKDPTTTTTVSQIPSKTASASPAPTITTVITTTTITRSTSSSSSTTCLTPGWFGRCKDLTTTTPAPTSSSHPPQPNPSSQSSRSSQTSTTTTTTTCTSKRWFGLICADPTTSSSTSRPSPSHLPTTRRKTCVSRHWYGVCKEWRSDDDPQVYKSDL